MSFINKRNILYPYQYGFRKDHSSSHAILDLTTTVYDAINDKKLACLVMIDLKKAFDTVCHKRLLLLKLNNYGIRGKAYDLIKSYLTNQYQYVRINNNSSTLKQIKYCVQQGSILGPLLYIIYVNDSSNAINCNSKLYADDTCLIIKEFIDSIRLSINKEVVIVNRWKNANQLTTNPKKLTILLIQPTLKNVPLNLEIRFKNHNISPCEYVNHLGINLDQYLNFKPHISILAKKKCKKCGNVVEIKKIFAKEDSHFLISRFRTFTFIVWHCDLGTKCFVK